MKKLNKIFILKRLWRWLLHRPDDTIFLSNIKEAALIFHTCKEYECWADDGEKEHGINWGRRRCKDCGKIQYAFFSRWGDRRIIWKDLD